MIVIFEGFDKTGKSTLKAEFDKYTDFKYVTIDRFVASNLFYDRYFDRLTPERKRRYDMDIIDLCDAPYIVVLCEANIEDIKARHIFYKEEFPKPKGELQYDIVNGFRECVAECYHNDCWLTINTSEVDLLDAINTIKDFVEELERIGEKI